MNSMCIQKGKCMGFLKADGVNVCDIWSTLFDCYFNNPVKILFIKTLMLTVIKWLI